MNFFCGIQYGFRANFLLQTSIHHKRVVFVDLVTIFTFDGQVVVTSAVVAADLGEAVVVDLSVLKNSTIFGKTVITK